VLFWLFVMMLIVAIVYVPRRDVRLAMLTAGTIGLFVGL
jgi:hypothetical protein